MSMSVSAGMSTDTSVEYFLAVIAPDNLLVDDYIYGFSKYSIENRLRSLEKTREKEVQLLKYKYWGEVGPVFSKLMKSKSKSAQMKNGDDVIKYLREKLPKEVMVALTKIKYIESQRIIYASKLSTKVEYEPFTLAI